VAADESERARARAPWDNNDLGQVSGSVFPGGELDD